MLDASPKLASENTWVRTIGGGHNGYLDIRLDLGIVGLCLLILFMAISFQTIGKLGSRPLFRSLSYLAVFVFLAFRNTMESTILWSTHFDNLIFLLVCFLACYDEAPHEKRTLPVTSWQAQEPSVGRL
ncbi:MAG: hypothetical protein ACR2QH_01735, partial [Geminicoccaceae bacterium]